MRRFFLAVAVLLVLIAGAVAILMRPPQALVDTWLLPRLKSASGLEWSLAGRTTVAFFPVPKVRLERVSISDPNGAPAPKLMDAEAIEVGLAWAPLWQRKVEVTSVEIEALAVDAATVQRFVADRRTVAPVRSASTPTAVSLPAFVRVRGGKLFGGGTQQRSLADNIDVTMTRQDQTGPLTLKAAFRIDQRDGAAAATIAALDDMLAGKTSTATLSLKFADATLDLQGVVTGGPKSPHFSGHAAGATTSLRGLIDLWAGNDMPPGTGFGVAKLDGELTAGKDQVSLANALFSLDQTKGNGELKIDLSGTRPRLTGKIAADRIDAGVYAPQWIRPRSAGTLESAAAPAVEVELVPIKEALRAHLEALAGERAPSDGGQLEAMSPGSNTFSDSPISLSFLEAVDLDLDLSVANLDIGRLTVAVPRVLATLNDRALKLNAPDLGINGGKVTATIAVDGRAPSMTIQSNLSGDELQVEPVFALFDLKPVLAGSAAFKANLTATGRSARDLISGLSGNVNVESRRGNIVGWDVRQDWVRMVFSRQLGDYNRRARTPYDLIQTDVAVTAGDVRQSNFRVASPVLALNGGGTAKLINQRLDIRAKLASAIPPTLRIPFRLSGAWSKPQLGLDPEDGGLLGVIASLFEPTGTTAKGSELDDPEMRRLMRRAKERSDQGRTLDADTADGLRTFDLQLR